MRFAVLAMLLSASLPLWGQIDNGNITGRVTDPTGAAIVGAQVTVTQTEMNFETLTTTNEEGLYRALNLRPGPYRVTVLAPGFKKMVRESIELLLRPSPNLYILPKAHQNLLRKRQLQLNV